MQARHRKTTLRSIFEAIESEDFAQAAALSRARFDARDEYWLYAARIGAELLIRLGDHGAARMLYEAVEKTKALPWARLGIARAEVEAGDLTQATSMLEALISSQPGFADAWITSVAQRFCVSKASADMLCKSVQEYEPHVALIRSGHTEIKIEASASMIDKVEELRRRFCSKGTQVALGGAANRAAGGVMIRS